MCDEITVKKLKCKRCGNSWWPINPEKQEPKYCPRCKSPNWRTEKKSVWEVRDEKKNMQK